MLEYQGIQFYKIRQFLMHIWSRVLVIIINILFIFLITLNADWMQKLDKSSQLLNTRKEGKFLTRRIMLIFTLMYTEF